VGRDVRAGDWRRRPAGARRLNEELRKRGIFEAGDSLESPSSATTVRLKNGKPLMTDGPVAETKEQLGGYIIVEAKDLDEAIAIATRNPVLRAAFSIEVRPIRERGPDRA
jgi:hypothetical protein